MSQTFYLKYRPQTIAELDLNGVRDQLQKIVASGRMPHAFLFAGPRGSGKTSTARIIAKVINCERIVNSAQETVNRKNSVKASQTTNYKLQPNPPTGREPCNKCSQCLSITKGSSLDVVEIDAASNRGVEDIRTLRETVKLSPAGSRKKVYIIDEAHMLTTEAANALLKTLEEPPDHVVFILATTAGEKLLDTIRSRCTAINFYKGKEEEVVRSLKKVIVGEKLEIDDDALLGIAGRVDGSFREAHKILEQLSFLDKKITSGDVQSLFQTNTVDPKKLLALLADKKAKQALQEIEELVDKGMNIKVYMTEIISLLRLTLLSLLGVGEKTGVDGFETKDLNRLLSLLSEAFRQYPTAFIPQLPLEMAVVEWCIGENPKSKIQMTNEKQEIEESGKKKSEKEPIIDSDESEDKGVGAGVQNLERVKSITGSPVSSLSPEELGNLWPQIMQSAKDKNRSVEALLRAARPTAYDGKALHLEVFYKFHKERLEKEPFREVVESSASSVIGAPLKLVFVLTEGKKRAADVANVASPDDTDLAKAAEEIFGLSGDGKVH